jgi:hypothetical protein
MDAGVHPVRVSQMKYIAFRQGAPRFTAANGRVGSFSRCLFTKRTQCLQRGDHKGRKWTVILRRGRAEKYRMLYI